MPAMRHFRYLWLLVPLAGVAEPVLAAYQGHRAPTAEKWQALKPRVAALAGPRDFVIVAPEWAEPLARQALGDALMPIASVARADEAPFERALEIDELGATAPLVASWPILSEEQAGDFRLRIRKNPGYRPPSFTLLDHLRPSDVRVTETHQGQTRECEYSARAPTSAGGLHGHPAFPRERFTCGRAETDFVGSTIIDDQNYAPRRCIWANPAVGDSLTLSFPNVKLSARIQGYAGLPYFLFRDEGWPKIGLTVAINGTMLGNYEHAPETGWHGFTFDTTQFAGQTATVDFTIQSSHDAREASFCFYADMR